MCADAVQVNSSSPEVSVCSRVRGALGRRVAGGPLCTAPRVVFLVVFAAGEFFFPHVCTSAQAAELGARFSPSCRTHEVALWSRLGWWRQRLGRALAGAGAVGTGVHVSYRNPAGDSWTVYPEVFLSREHAARRHPGCAVRELPLRGSEDFALSRARGSVRRAPA